jgi:SAM-dependent methyltransferase
MRRALLATAEAAADYRPAGNELRFYCALATQCFINEYVFAAEPEELERAERLRQALTDALASRRAVPALWVIAVGSYFALHAIAHAPQLLVRSWPEALHTLLSRQVREPREEEDYAASVSRLTPIEDEVSLSVKQQYEENPYPRWIITPSQRQSIAFDEWVGAKFPSSSFQRLGDKDAVDILIAGCGTGKHAIDTAAWCAGARVLAVDLSRKSLGYAVRKSRAARVKNVEYAQADIMRLETLGRDFDLVDSSGVLHHLADPMAGWRVLLALVRPLGFMRIGLYSEIARKDIAAARALAAERDYGPTAEDIRRCRQDLLNVPALRVARWYDFFSMSECRDLLFHVQEVPVTIPQIEAFINQHGLHFIGFELGPAVRQEYLRRFPKDQSLTNLSSWHVFETERPDTFASMYQFWVQKK